MVQNISWIFKWLTKEPQNKAKIDIITEKKGQIHNHRDFKKSLLETDRLSRPIPGFRIFK